MKWIFVFMWLFELEIEMLIVLSKGNIDKNKFHKVVLWKTMFCNIIERKNTSCRFSKLVGDEFHCFYTRPYLLWFAGDEFPYSLHHAKISCCVLLLMSCLIFTPVFTSCDLLVMSCLIFTPCQNCLWVICWGRALLFYCTMLKLPVVICWWWALLFFTPCQTCLLLFFVDELPYFYTMPKFPVVCCCWWAALFLHQSLPVVIYWWLAPLSFTPCQNCLLLFAGDELPYFLHHAKIAWARLFKILDKVVHWTTPYPVDSYPVDKICCSKTRTMVG